MTTAFDLRRIALWLALSASLMTAVVPAAGLVLCMHPDAGIEFGVGIELGCPCDHVGDHERGHDHDHGYPGDAPEPCCHVAVDGLDGTTPLERAAVDDLQLTAWLDAAALVAVGVVAEPDPDPVALGPPKREPPAMRRLLDARRATVLLI